VDFRCRITGSFFFCPTFVCFFHCGLLSLTAHTLADSSKLPFRACPRLFAPSRFFTNHVHLPRLGWEKELVPRIPPGWLTPEEECPPPPPPFQNTFFASNIFFISGPLCAYCVGPTSHQQMIFAGTLRPGGRGCWVVTLYCTGEW